MDLLRRVWADADDDARLALSDLLIEGPPDELLSHLEREERIKSRDRRIYDRIETIKRLKHPSLTKELIEEKSRIQERYPNWRPAEGESADFSSWMEFRSGPDSPFALRDLVQMPADLVAEVLRTTEDRREGTVDVWRSVAAAEPEKALDVLRLLPVDGSLTDVWIHGLWGIREKATLEPVRSGVLDQLALLPENFLGLSEVASASADILEAASRARPSMDDQSNFWSLFDRVLVGVSGDPSNMDTPSGGGGWVSLAINRSMGTLATAFFNVMFGRTLKVGEGIPPDLKQRLDMLVAPTLPDHRPARVIAASRLSYLFAVDPSWTQTNLLPLFDWGNEIEAIAMWQGFAWQPRIDDQLWSALKPYFLAMFTRERLAALGHSASQMASMLMLVGVEFGHGELPREAARSAIRAMDQQVRTEAAAWIAGYLREHNEDQHQDTEAMSVDRAWFDRVAPWLTKVWPPEPDPDGRGVSAQFARGIVAVDDAFADALRVLSPFLLKGTADLALHDLGESDHPELHPDMTMSLLEKIVDLDRIWIAEDLRDILDRVRQASPEMAAGNLFRRFDEALRARMT